MKDNLNANIDKKVTKPTDSNNRKQYCLMILGMHLFLDRFRKL